MPEAEFYLMPLFVRLSVRDVAASANWYAETLGFKSVFSAADTGSGQRMNHLRLGRYQDLVLVPASGSDDGPRGHGVAVYLTLREGIESIAQRAASAGLQVKGPADTPWNTREFTVRDPDGYILVFAQPKTAHATLPI